ncbi:Adrenocorticotropic hormone receptor [Oryzias melastigma]|uniref:Adrenocorticotropic hormone receptor n=1 Tax=Oryzias melastigma TaxID=30732 RepID=A0A834CG89_ORYME|nr:Adrenocorticotropic hormone receptor [Oryzias melastigma]
MAPANDVFPTTFQSVNVTESLPRNATSPVKVASVIHWLTFTIGLPALGLAMYVLKNLSKGLAPFKLRLFLFPSVSFYYHALPAGQTKVPIQAKFLLVSDIISFLGRPNINVSTQDATLFSSGASEFIFYFSVASNITMMFVIAQERHLLVTCRPFRACCSRVRHSRVMALVTWASPFAILALAMLNYQLWFAVALLAPFPFLLFFTMDGWRSLHCLSRPSAEKRRAAWGISVILVNYTFLYSPFIVSILLAALSLKEPVWYLGLVSHMLLYLSPLVDPFIYIFMTEGLKEVLRALPCCQYLHRQQEMRPTVTTVTETVLMETKL